MSPLYATDDNAQLQSAQRKCITIVKYSRGVGLGFIPIDPRAVDRAQIGNRNLGLNVDGGVQARNTIIVGIIG